MSELTPPANYQYEPTAGEIVLAILKIVAIIAAIIVVLLLITKIIPVIIKKLRKQAVQAEQGDGFGETIEQKASTAPKPQNSGSSCAGTFFRFFLKLALIVGIALFALVNYRAFSFDKGWSTVDINQMSTQQVVKSLTSIQKVEYYKNTFSNGYKIFVSTTNENYLLDATKDDLDAINALSILSKTKPQKITPIPFYVEIIVGIIVLVIPFGGRKKSQVVNDESD